MVVDTKGNVEIKGAAKSVTLFKIRVKSKKLRKNKEKREKESRSPPVAGEAGPSLSVEKRDDGVVKDELPRHEKYQNKRRSALKNDRIRRQVFRICDHIVRRQSKLASAAKTPEQVPGRIRLQIGESDLNEMKKKLRSIEIPFSEAREEAVEETKAPPEEESEKEESGDDEKKDEVNEVKDHKAEETEGIEDVKHKETESSDDKDQEAAVKVPEKRNPCLTVFVGDIETVMSCEDAVDDFLDEMDDHIMDTTANEAKGRRGLVESSFFDFFQCGGAEYSADEVEDSDDSGSVDSRVFRSQQETAIPSTLTKSYYFGSLSLFNFINMFKCGTTSVVHDESEEKASPPAHTTDSFKAHDVHSPQDDGESSVETERLSVKGTSTKVETAGNVHGRQEDQVHAENNKVAAQKDATKVDRKRVKEKDDAGDQKQEIGIVDIFPVFGFISDVLGECFLVSMSQKPALPPNKPAEPEKKKKRKKSKKKRKSSRLPKEFRKASPSLRKDEVLPPLFGLLHRVGDSLYVDPLSSPSFGAVDAYDNETFFDDFNQHKHEANKTQSSENKSPSQLEDEYIMKALAALGLISSEEEKEKIDLTPDENAFHLSGILSRIGDVFYVDPLSSPEFGRHYDNLGAEDGVESRQDPMHEKPKSAGLFSALNFGL